MEIKGFKMGSIEGIAIDLRINDLYFKRVAIFKDILKFGRMFLHHVLEEKLIFGKTTSTRSYRPSND